MGAIEYGWLFLKAQQVTNASRQAARYAIRPDATTEAVLASIDNMMALAGMGASGYAVNLTPEDITLLPTGEYVEVEITVPSASLVLIDAGFLPVPANLKSSVVMTKEGP
jgi:Flp pilus assembly protein TadG